MTRLEELFAAEAEAARAHQADPLDPQKKQAWVDARSATNAERGEED